MEAAEIAFGKFPFFYRVLSINFVCRAVTIFCFLFILTSICRYFYRGFRMRKTRNKKREQRSSTKGKLLQKLIGMKTPMENRHTVTTRQFSEISRQLVNDEIAAVDVLEAYQAKALEIDHQINCITDVVYDADVTALYLDSLPKEERGRLHGIPLSVQDSISQDDFDSYFGCVSRCFKPEKKTAPVIEALTDEGMVPFVRTMTSQTDFSLVCRSHLFGETLNPLGKNRVCEGPSGEGAMIGSKGSLVGIGVDVCGGIRVSSSLCGIFGFKPTHERVGRNNVSKFILSHRPVACEATVGPVSSDFDLLVEVIRVIFSKSLFSLDSRIPSICFNDKFFESQEPMTIGFYKSFSDDKLTFSSVPAVERVIDEVKAALEKRGHTLVEWEPPRIDYASQLLVTALYADGGEASCQLSKVEKVQNTLHWLAGFDRFTKCILTSILKLKNPILSEYLNASSSLNSAFDALQHMDKIYEYRLECDESWSDAKLDAVVCPILPFASSSVKSSVDSIPGLLYSYIYNFLDYPSGVVPASEVTQEDVENLSSSYFGNITTNMMNSEKQSLGQPLSVQCVGCQYQDEKVLRLMREIKLAMVERH